eukprot:scaffold3515_cov126-Cylindrotheca_fusiformis.AAC.49
MVEMTRRGITTRLPHDYVPDKYTILCGRGRVYTTSTGNQHLKYLIHKHLKGYSEAPSKVEKSAIVSEIMETVESVCPAPQFVKFQHGVWWEVDNAFAREKIGCMFRDALHTQYRSSTKAKFARKKAQSPSTMRQAEGAGTIVSIGSSSSVASRNSNQTYNSSLTEEMLGSLSFNMKHPAPTPAALRDYQTSTSSYHTAASSQSRILDAPINHCIMPFRNNLSLLTGQNLLDDFPDDLSGIFDD